MKKVCYFLGLLFASSHAHAEADGPDFYRITGTTPAPMYAAKAETSQLILLLPPDTDGLKNLGCTGIPTFSAWQNMTEAERQAAKQNSWCKIDVNSRQGWIKQQFLAEGSAVTAKPSFDCTAPRPHEIEILICGNPELIALDNKMQQRYQAALNAANALDADTAQAIDTLKKSQSGWLKGRNECWKALDARTSCTINEYRQRMAYLQVKWQLVKPTTTARYSCNAAKTDELTAYFFPDAEVPGVAIDYGDSRAVLTQQPAESGTRYVGNFGKVFWVTGQQAKFTWTPAEAVKTCTLASD
ncbi:MliC family protein [Shewanella sp.]|uniref:MliC family protein n=1 Tax=Shewanella sp. TaxID=50422 RepID=UPI003A96AAA1